MDRHHPASSPAAADWHCRECGASNRGYAAFCIGCGEPPAADALAAPPPAEDRPAPAPPYQRAAQVVVALAVVAGLAWLLGNWYLDETHATSYRQGAAAVAAHDWPRAAAQFHAAGSYSDAAGRATQAEQTLRDLAQLRQNIQHADAARDWRTMLTLLGQELQLDPGNGEALEDQTYARNQLLDREAAGTLYLITDGAAAGLYLNLPGRRDIKLPGSDGKSRPRAINANGSSLVYDRPIHPPAAGESASDGPREAVLAAFGGPPKAPAGAQFMMGFQVLAPAIFPNLSGQFTAGGLFWQTYSADDGRYEDSLIYYRLADSRTFFVRASGMWSYVPAQSTATGVILTVNPPPLDDDQAPGLLSIGRPDAAPLLAMHLAGWVTDASFSADGHYLIFTMQHGSTDSVLSTSLYAVSLPAGSAPPLTVQFLQSITSIGPNSPQLSAEFVPDGANTPSQILVTEVDDGVQTLSLERLADGIVVPVAKGPAPLSSSAHVLSSDGAWVAYTADTASGTRLVLQRLKVGAPALTLADAGFRGGVTNLQFSPGSRYLTYRTPGATPGTPGSLYSLDLSGPMASGPPNPTLRPIYLGAATPDGADPALALAPGGNLLLYLDVQHTLHAVTYDGSLDVPVSLPGPVAAVWTLRP